MSIPIRNNFDLEEVGVEIKKIIPDDLPKREIVKLLYEFIQENTRYILVSLQDGGHVPMKSQDVHDLKYGDCKALSFYMQSLLGLYNIKSNYILNKSSHGFKESMNSEFYDAYQANHAIVHVPLESDTLWMDCTSHDKPFNFLGSFTDDRLVLAVNESGGTLVRTPKYGADLFKDICNTEITVLDNGSISVDYDMTSHGLAMEDRIYLSKKSKEDQIDDITEDFDHLMNLKISDLTIDIDKDNLTSTEHYTIECQQYGEHAGQYYIMPLRFEPLSVPNFGKRKTRKYPILFERAYKEIKEDTYSFPDGFIPNLNELNVNHESQYGKYTRSVEKLSETKFIVKRCFELTEGEYPASEYLKIKSFFNKIRKDELSKMTIEKKTIRP